MNIDTSKENIQPLRGGRDVTRLVPALEAQHDEEMRQQLKQERLEFENRISNYSGPDPLNDWFEFICWTEQSYPKKGHEGSLDQLILKCLTVFEHNTQYFQDARMIKLWMKYIDTQPNPTEIYWNLHNRGVGTMIADLYIGWAYYYQAANDFQHARYIYKLGLKAHAQPFVQLQSSYDNFKSTYLEQQQQPADAMRLQRNQDSLAEQRQALTSLRPFKRKNVATVASQRTGDNVRSLNPGVIQAVQQPAGTSRGAVPKSNRQIYVYEDGMDGDNMGPPGSLKNPISILEARKVPENIHEPGPWTRPKGLNPTMHLPTNTPFQIHEDAPVQPQFPPCEVDWSDWHPPMFVPDTDGNNARAMYIKSQVYQQYSEYSFEEINAMKYFKKLRDNQQQQHESYANQQNNQHFEQQQQQNNQHDLYANQQNNQQAEGFIQQNTQQQDQQYVNQQYQTRSEFGNQLNGQYQQNIHQQNQMYQQTQQYQHVNQQHVNQHDSMIYNVQKNSYENHLIENSVGVTEQYNSNQSRLPSTPEQHHPMNPQQHMSQHYVSPQNMSQNNYARSQTQPNWVQHNMSHQNLNASHPNLVHQNISQPNMVHMQQPNYAQPNYGQNMSQASSRHMMQGHGLNSTNQYLSPHQNSVNLLNNTQQQHQQHQPLTIYQDPVNEQPHNLRHAQQHNQPQQQVYLTERQQQQQQSPQQHQQYMSNENMLYARQQHTSPRVQPQMNHQSPVVEHSYVGNHYQTPNRSQHLGHNPQVNNQYGIPHTPETNGVPRTRYQYPNTPNQIYDEASFLGNIYDPQASTPVIKKDAVRTVHQYPNTPTTQIFDETCSTQAFHANMFKAQVSTPVQKEVVSPVYKQQISNEQITKTSPDLVHILSSKQSEEEILFASRETIQMKPHLSAIMENTENQTATPSASVESNQTSTINSITPNQNTSKPKTPTSKPGTVIVLDSPDKPNMELLTDSPKVFVIAKSKDTKLIPNRCVTPPNKYTEYRIKSDNSPTPKKTSPLPSTPDIFRKQMNEQRNFIFTTKPSPNISKSMKNTLHISINDNSNSNNNQWKQMDDSSVDDYEMDCQDFPDETEKNYAESIIKKHLDKDVVDPFNSELCEAFLNKIGFPDRDDKSFISVHNITQLKQGMNYSVGPKHYAVEKELGRGAFGSIYRAVDSSTGETVALKYQKPSRIWEYYICQEIRKRVTNHDILPGFMQVSTALICRSSSILVSEFGKYGSLLNTSNKVKQMTSKSMHELVVMSISAQLLSVVFHLHQAKIIHGDIKPDNILVMNFPMEYSHIPFIQFIDFGCAIDMSLFPEGTEFKTVVTTDGFTCTEMQEGRPWTYQTDLFCLAGTVHVCLFGEYMKLCKRGREWAIKANFPRYFQRHIWQNFFSKLLNISSGENLPDLQQLKSSFEEHLSRNQKDYGERVRFIANIMNGR